MPQIIGPSGGVRFEVKGTAELREAMAKLAKASQGKIIRQAARASGNLLLAAAKARAPVNQEHAKAVANIKAKAKQFKGGTARKLYKKLAIEHLTARLGVAKQLPGTLKRAIKLRVSKFQKRGTVQLIVQTGSRADMGIDPSSPYYYPAHVEYGHGLAGEAGQGSKAVPPHPFMRPAWDATKEPAAMLAENTMRELMEEEIRSAAFILSGGAA